MIAKQTMGRITQRKDFNKSEPWPGYGIGINSRLVS